MNSRARQMQTSAKERVIFLSSHSDNVRGVAFSPRPETLHLFCSGGYDGMVHIYDARTATTECSVAVGNLSGDVPTRVHSVRWSCDGGLVYAGGMGQCSIIDANTGIIIKSYDRGFWVGPDRAALATHPSDRNIALGTGPSGRDITLFDFRQDGPVSLGSQHHRCIRDITFLTPLWSAGRGGNGPLFITAAQDKRAQVMDLRGTLLETIESDTPLFSVSITSSLSPDPCIALGGDGPLQLFDRTGTAIARFGESRLPVWKTCFTSLGNTLYASSDDGNVRTYAKCPTPTGFTYVYYGPLYKHKRDIEDAALSLNDEYLVTASQDRTVGLLKVGMPTFGSSEVGTLNLT